ncbi:MAG: uroporphyrinogen decarboxylase family protein [Planctomycetota bacterium]|jgi:uroporphyrinogen decarboxylase
MTPKERVLTALSHKDPDRCPCDYIGTPEVDEKLKAHFGTESMDVVLERLGVDLRVVDAPYVGPELRVWDDGRFENYWGSIRKPVRNEAGTYNEAVELPYSSFKSVEDVEKFRWPKVEWFDYSQLAEECRKYSDYAVVFGSPGNMDLINGTAYGRGVEQVIYDIALEDAVGLACMEKRFECCYERSEQGLKAANGKIDILWIGDDYGTQNGLLISPEKWRKLFFPRLKAMCALGHRYGAKVMLHSCGSTRPLWDGLIEAGVDIYQTVQPEARDMDPAELKAEFGDRMCLHGTISIQKTLPFGTPADVSAEVRQRIETVGKNGGLIVAPAHNTQPDTPVENILALYETVERS